MRVRPPPPAVPGWMVTNSRTMLRSPISRRVGSPRYFRSWGARPIEQNGKRWHSGPIVVSPSMTTWESRTVPRPDPHLGAHDAVGAHAHARAQHRPGATRAVGSTCGCGQGRPPGAAGSPPPRGARPRGPRPGCGRAPRAGGGGAPRGGAGRRARPAGGTWRRRSRPRGSRAGRGPAASWSSQMPAAWARLSMSSTPGITGAPGKWPSKNSSEPVTFLMATSRPAGSCSSTRSTRTKGYWLGIWRTRRPMSMARAPLPVAPAGPRSGRSGEAAGLRLGGGRRRPAPAGAGAGAAAADGAWPPSRRRPPSRSRRARCRTPCSR